MTLPPRTLIEIRELSRRDAKTGRLLLDHVDLMLRGGDAVGLVGPTGSGKSSLLRAIARLDRCDLGQVLYLGKTVYGDAVPRYRRDVVYLPQRPAFVAGSVRENLELPFRLQAADSMLDVSQAIGWLGDFMRNQRMLEQSVERLSGGEQQIIALIRALTLSPKILLLDEPTAALDAAATERYESLVSFWHRGSDGISETDRALVWTSHDVAQVQRVTTRMTSMHDGALTEQSPDA